MPESSALPHWDMTAIYPGLDSSEFETGFDALNAAIAATVALFDNHGIMLRSEPLTVNEETVAIFETVLAQLNRVSEQTHLHYAYLSSFIATNSRDANAQTWMSKLQINMTAFEKLTTRFTAWIGSLADAETLIEQSTAAREHAYAVREACIEAKHLMSPPEEALATELNLTGGRAWSKFYNNFSSQITAEIVIGGKAQVLPMTAIRNLAFEESRETRQRAYEVELAVWETNAMPVAAALNSIKGQMLTLSTRRGWDSPLDVALFNNHIDRETLDVMLETAREYFPVFRRYLNTKARVLGLEKLPWFDLFAPVGKSEQVWDFDVARAFITEEFQAFSPRLGVQAERAFRERWIDAEPRDGKRGGAFCMWLRYDELLSATGMDDAATLAKRFGMDIHDAQFWQGSLQLLAEDVERFQALVEKA